MSATTSACTASAVGWVGLACRTRKMRSRCGRQLAAGGPEGIGELGGGAHRSSTARSTLARRQSLSIDLRVHDDFRARDDAGDTRSSCLVRRDPGVGPEATPAAEANPPCHSSRPSRQTRSTSREITRTPRPGPAPPTDDATGRPAGRRTARARARSQIVPGGRITWRGMRIRRVRLVSVAKLSFVFWLLAFAVLLGTAVARLERRQGVRLHRRDRGGRGDVRSGSTASRSTAASLFGVAAARPPRSCAASAG